MVGPIDATGPIVFFGDIGKSEKGKAGHEWAITGFGNSAAHCQLKCSFNGFQNWATSMISMPRWGQGLANGDSHCDHPRLTGHIGCLRPGISGASGDQVALIGDLVGGFCADRPSDGGLSFAVDIGHRIHASAAVAHATVYFASDGGEIYA